MTLTFGSLFAGIGGMDLGLERAGMQCVWQVEIDDYANRVLGRHWPNVRRWRDIRTFPPDADHEGQPDGAVNAEERGWDSRTSGWYADLICGGFPCQDISYAGKGAGLAGERSGLFYEAIRVVRLIRPRYVLLENVAALLTRGLDQVLGTLASVGYDAEWHCIPAAAVGAPHIRDRVFVISHAEGIGRGARRKGRTAGTGAQQEDEADVADANGSGFAGKFGRNEAGEADATGRCCARLVDRSDWWNTEPDVGRVAHGVPARVDRLRGLGNAVVPQVAEWIGRQIVAYEMGLNQGSAQDNQP